eukprot:gene21452-41508_t
MLQGLSHTARDARSWPFEQARLLLDRITRLRLSDAERDLAAALFMQGKFHEAVAALPALAQATPTIRFAAVFSDKDIRAEMMNMFAKDIAADFKVEQHLNSTLFRQGTELVALQRDNLEMGNIAPQDISKQVPAWSVL